MNPFSGIQGRGTRRQSSGRKDYESIPSEHGNYEVIYDEMSIYEKKENRMNPSMSRRRILNEYDSGKYTYIYIFLRLVVNHMQFPFLTEKVGVNYFEDNKNLPQ